MGSPVKVIFAFVCVFIAGAVFGGFFTARTASRKIQEVQQPQAAVPVAPAPQASQTPAPAPANNRPNNANRAGALTITPVMLQQLAVQLKLTDEQKEKVQPIVKRSAEDMNFLRQENFRATNRVLERMHSEIALLLTPEQRSELEIQKRIMQDRLQQAEKQRKNERLLQKASPANRANPDTAAKSN
jgi:hypothetical protein